MPVVAWRITARRDPAGAFDGEGARLFGGRWNRVGTRMVYASEHLSLAALELLVHLDAEDAPARLFRFRCELPDDAVERLPRTRLPRRWREYPAPEATAALGSEWAARGEALALAVPSAVVPEELNYLLNPAHPRFAELALSPGEPFSFDPRVWKRS